MGRTVEADEHQCEIGLFPASMIPQPWMQKRRHSPATLCICRKKYYCWNLNKWFTVNKFFQAKKEARDE